jgi:hypothetical protein
VGLSGLLGENLRLRLGDGCVCTCTCTCSCSGRLLCLPLGLPCDLAGVAPLGVLPLHLRELLLLGLGEKEPHSALATDDGLTCRLLVLAGLAALGTPRGGLPVVLREERLVLAREDEAVRAVAAREVHVLEERLLGPLLTLLAWSLPTLRLDLGSRLLLLGGLLVGVALLQDSDLLLHPIDETAHLRRVVANRDATLEVGEIGLGLEQRLVDCERHSGVGWKEREVC